MGRGSSSMQKVGYFNQEKREYTIQEMFPKRPWMNYLWNDRFIAFINQFGCGKSMYLQSNGNSRQLCRARDSRLIFIRDEETKDYWAANRNFHKEDFESFYTNVGLGYSEICSKYKNIGVSFNLFIPMGGLFECWEVSVENHGDEERTLSLFSYADVSLPTYDEWAYSTRADFDNRLQGIYLVNSEFGFHTPYSDIFFVCEGSSVSFETSNRRFRGVYGEIGSPEALKSEKLDSQGTSFDDSTVAVLQCKFSLKSRERKSIKYLLGLCTSPDEAVRIKNVCLNGTFFEEEREKIRYNCDQYINRMNLSTPDETINSLANVWLKRQIDLGKAWGRVYTKGFRDIMQDVTALMPLDSHAACEKIKHCLNYQYENGNTIRSWEPDDFHPYRDGAAWIVPAVTCYIKETGDFSFLEEQVCYYGNKDQGSILDHCRRGIDFLHSELGEHGLCLIGGGDWNDSLNNAGLKLLGESVWLSIATVKSTNDFIELLEYLGLDSEAEKYRNMNELLIRNIKCFGWEQDHFIYGYTDWAEKFGSYGNEEGQLYLNPQTWAVLAGILQEEEAGKLMDLVEKELTCSYGYVQLKPGYSKRNSHLGRITYMDIGNYENASVYNHGVTFKIAADCKIGRGNQAYQSVLKMLGSNPHHSSLISGVEPYVITNMYLGPENAYRKGDSVMSWITGAAGWLFRCIYEYMAGIQADYSGLRINPCLPAHWKEIGVRREYRGAIYEILIQNPEALETGYLGIIVDGVAMNGRTVPVFSDGKTHRIEVRMYRSPDNASEVEKS